MPAQIQELKLTHAKEMEAMRADLNEIKTALSDSKPCVRWENFDTKKRDRMGNRQRSQEAFRRNQKKCPECEMKNYFRCFHCFICCPVVIENEEKDNEESSKEEENNEVRRSSRKGKPTVLTYDAVGG